MLLDFCPNCGHKTISEVKRKLMGHKVTVRRICAVCNFSWPETVERKEVKRPSIAWQSGGRT